MIKVLDLVKDFQLTKQQQKEINSANQIHRAVDHVSFVCHPGRVYSLLGPNGAGKTTTLRMLSTIFTPTSGAIEICGVDAIKEPERARSKIGFLTGSTGLYARLTPHEVIDYFGALYNVSKADIQKRKLKLIELLNMGDFMNKRIGKLSTGMKQKVSIARTMIHDPEVLIFDEPTSGLDVITAENIISLIKDCRTEGKTVIFSSHIMSEVDLLCDDLAIIHKGIIKYEGSMEEYRKNMLEKNLTQEFIRIVNS